MGIIPALGVEFEVAQDLLSQVTAAAAATQAGLVAGATAARGVQSEATAGLSQLLQALSETTVGATDLGRAATATADETRNGLAAARAAASAGRASLEHGQNQVTARFDDLSGVAGGTRGHASADAAAVRESAAGTRAAATTAGETHHRLLAAAEKGGTQVAEAAADHAARLQRAHDDGLQALARLCDGLRQHEEKLSSDVASLGGWLEKEHQARVQGAHEGHRAAIDEHLARTATRAEQHRAEYRDRTSQAGSAFASHLSDVLAPHLDASQMRATQAVQVAEEPVLQTTRTVDAAAPHATHVVETLRDLESMERTLKADDWRLA